MRRVPQRRVNPPEGAAAGVDVGDDRQAQAGVRGGVVGHEEQVVDQGAQQVRRAAAACPCPPTSSRALFVPMRELLPPARIAAEHPGKPGGACFRVPITALRSSEPVAALATVVLDAPATLQVPVLFRKV